MIRSLSVLLLTITFLGGFGCTSQPSSEVQTMVVYFDTATRKPVISEPSNQSPAPHPVTGKRTLMPAVYCSKCRTWHAAPPIEELQRNPKALVCTKTGAKLTFDGPLPEDSP